jgi:hypothetical protein
MTAKNFLHIKPNPRVLEDRQFSKNVNKKRCQSPTKRIKCKKNFELTIAKATKTTKKTLQTHRKFPS